MAFFTYKVLNKEKEVVEGTIGARSKEEAADLLQKKGLQPITIKETNKGKKRTKSLPSVEKITFCRYMSAMLKSGLSLSSGIEVLEEETKSPVMKKILNSMTYGLERGQTLSVIFSQYPDVFDQFFLTLVHVGEVSGTLGDVFSYLEKGLRSEYSLSQKVKGALLYPAVVFIAMTAIGFLMFFFVLPQIGKVFLSTNLELPFATKTLFEVSILVSENIQFVLLGMLVLFVLFVILVRTKTGRHFLLTAILPIPIVRNLLQRIDLARFTRIFSTLLASAVPIVESLDISVESFSWPRYKKAGEKIKKSIIQGKGLSETFKKQNVFPALLIQMIAAGEKTGTLDSTLADLASFYEEKVEEEVKSITQILEPVLILLVGISIGAMVLSIIAPIYSVVSTLQSKIGS